MLKFLFPALNQNEKTIESKLSKLSTIIVAFTFLLLVPILSYVTLDSFESHKAFYLIFSFTVYNISYLFTLYFPAVIVNIIDSIFYKTSYTTVQYVRALLPLKLLFVYLEILIKSFTPIVFMEKAILLLNIWFCVNMFISLTNVFLYTKLKAIIPIFIYAFFVLVPIIT